MLAHAERRTDARQFQRRAQQALAHVLAIGGEVAVGEPHRAQLAPLVDEFGRQHASGAQLPAVRKMRFVEHREAVALAQAALEIDVAAEHVGQLERHAVRDAGAVRRAEQRRLDLRRFQFRARADLDAPFLRDQCLADALDAHQAVARGEELQPDELARVLAVGAHFGGDDGARAQPPHFALSQQLLRIGIADRQPGEQAAERVAALQAVLAHVSGRRRQQSLVQANRDRLQHRGLREEQLDVGRRDDARDGGDRAQDGKDPQGRDTLQRRVFTHESARIPCYSDTWKV